MTTYVSATTEHRFPSKQELDAYVERGLVHASRHESLPLTVYCYSRTVQFERSWDDVTEQARGLVLDDNGQIVGAGLRKFFAYGDPIAVFPSRFEIHTAFDKVDGSLIHVGSYNGELITWTKGSFHSDHAVEALKYLNGFTPTEGTTTLFEGIFGPLNRIVVDYGEFQGLVLLGEVDLATGKDWAHPADVAEDTGWSGEIAVERNNVPVAQFVEMAADPENGEGREGWVIVWPRENAPAHRLKVKFVKYLSLHKLMTGLTERRIHEAYLRVLHNEPGADEEWETFLMQIPDELDSAVTEIITKITDHIEVLITEASFNAQRADEYAVEKGEGRKSTAEYMASIPSDRRALAWFLYDDKFDQAAYLAARSYESSTGMLMILPEDD